MSEQTPSKLQTAARVAAVGLFLVSSWIALAVVIVLGALAVVMIFDRYHALALGLTSAEQARWLWAGGLAFSLVCYAIGIFQAARWFALVPALRERQQAARPPRSRPEPVPEHEIQKTRPSPEEIRLRGMPRG